MTGHPRTDQRFDLVRRMHQEIFGQDTIPSRTDISSILRKEKGETISLANLHEYDLTQFLSIEAHQIRLTQISQETHPPIERKH